MRLVDHLPDRAGSGASGDRAGIAGITHETQVPPTPPTPRDGILDPLGEAYNLLDGQPPVARRGSNYKPYDE